MFKFWVQAGLMNFCNMFPRHWEPMPSIQSFKIHMFKSDFRLFMAFYQTISVFQTVCDADQHACMHPKSIVGNEQ